MLSSGSALLDAPSEREDITGGAAAPSVSDVFAQNAPGPELAPDFPLAAERMADFWIAIINGGNGGSLLREWRNNPNEVYRTDNALQQFNQARMGGGEFMGLPQHQADKFKEVMMDMILNSHAETLEITTRNIGKTARNGSILDYACREAEMRGAPHVLSRVDIRTILDQNAKGDLTLTIKRDGNSSSFTIPPRKAELYVMPAPPAAEEAPSLQHLDRASGF